MFSEIHTNKVNIRQLGLDSLTQRPILIPLSHQEVQGNVVTQYLVPLTSNRLDITYDQKSHDGTNLEFKI